MKEELPYFLVHKRPSDCPKAEVAIEISEGLAARIRRDPSCMACGALDGLEVVEKAKD